MMEVHEVIEYYNQNGLNETLDYFDIRHNTQRTEREKRLNQD